MGSLRAQRRSDHPRPSQRARRAHALIWRGARSQPDLSLEARSLVLELIERHSIRCDLKLTGHLTAAAKPADARAMQEEVQFLQEKMGYPNVRFLDASAMRAEVSARHHGGLIDELGGHLHPLNYTIGLARAAADAGVRIFEHSPATGVHNRDNGVQLDLRDAQVRHGPAFSPAMHSCRKLVPESPPTSCPSRTTSSLQSGCAGLMRSLRTIGQSPTDVLW